MAVFQTCDGVGGIGRSVYDTVYMAVGAIGGEDTAWQRF